MITTQQRSTNFLFMVPVMFSFFVMGFVDLVGIASNYVKADLQLTDSTANIFPSLVFFWFLIFSVPTGLMMNRIGRKRTVLLSLIVTAVALALPLCSHSFAVMLTAFSLLGIGNTLMQTSLNPLLSSMVSGKSLSSMLTFGQFVKAIASFLAPIIAAWGAQFNVFGMGWYILFPFYMVIAILAVLVLGAVPIDEEKPNGTSGFSATFALLRNPLVLCCFIGIMCHVGIDVGTNTTAPKILQEYAGMSLLDAGFATSVYFIFRTIGCFSGAVILARLSDRLFFFLSVALMIAGLSGFIFLRSETAIYVCIALIGYGNSNIFPITMAQALKTCPDKKNEVSGLMIMGLFGGTVFPLAMGMASDGVGSQIGAVAVMLAAVAYLFFFAFKIQKNG